MFTNIVQPLHLTLPLCSVFSFNHLFAQCLSKIVQTAMKHCQTRSQLQEGLHQETGISIKIWTKQVQIKQTVIKSNKNRNQHQNEETILKIQVQVHSKIMHGIWKIKCMLVWLSRLEKLLFWKYFFLLFYLFFQTSCPGG